MTAKVMGSCLMVWMAHPIATTKYAHHIHLLLHSSFRK